MSNLYCSFATTVLCVNQNAAEEAVLLHLELDKDVDGERYAGIDVTIEEGTDTLIIDGTGEYSDVDYLAQYLGELIEHELAVGPLSFTWAQFGGAFGGGAVIVAGRGDEASMNSWIWLTAELLELDRNGGTFN